MKQKPKAGNPLLWLFEPLEGDAGFVRKKLFNFDAAYIDGKLYVAVAAGNEPWNGILVCTSHPHHAAVIADFPQLAPHAVLGKWLYLSQTNPEFESVATDVVRLAQRRDSRLGVESRRASVKVHRD